MKSTKDYRQYPFKYSSESLEPEADVKMKNKTQEELISEIESLRREVAGLQASAALFRETETKYKLLIDNVYDLIWTIDANGVFTYASPSWKRILGYEPAYVMGRSMQDFVHPDDVVPCRKALQNLSQKMSGLVCKVKHATGTWQSHVMSVKPVFDSNGSYMFAIGNSIDITSRIQAEETLIEKWKLLSDIIEFLPDATLVINKESKVIAWNRAMEDMTGIKKEDMIGKSNYEYALAFYGYRRPMLVDFALHGDSLKEKKCAAIRGSGDILFAEVCMKDRPLGDLHLSAKASVLRNAQGAPTAAIECIRDNTEHQKLLDRLNRAEKMEALGTLAGGVAHDLNNVLGVQVGYSELLVKKLSAGSPLRNYANNILQSSLKSAAIIQDLLTLTRRGVAISEVTNLNQIIASSLSSPEFGKLKGYHPGVRLWTHLDEELFNIKGSPVHLGKMLINLISNAAEAISDMGEVVITTENRYLDCPIQGYDEMKEGDYAVLSVSDTGGGISDQDRAKMFEPFYTKKVMGRSGTGLGLTVVWGTVKDHHGYIDVHSEEGKGSTFTLYFPVCGGHAVKKDDILSTEAYAGRGEIILVVDDVMEQRNMAMSMLESLGYRVLAVAGGEEAVAYIEKESVDLILLDMIMDPGIDGLETYRRILKINPNQKAVVVSGFSETDQVRKTMKMGAGEFVRKPYTLEKIGLAIRRELDRNIHASKAGIC